MLSVIQLVAWIDPYKDTVESGNKSYEKGEYDRAIKEYKKSEKYMPRESSKYDLSFNRGDAEFKKKNYSKAIENYRLSLNSQDRDLQKKAFYNIGNASLKLGRYKEAMESFTNALKIDPTYEKAKKNIEYMLKNRKDKDKGDKDNKKDQENSKNDKDKNKKNNETDKGNKDKNRSGKMSKDQIKNILESMKNKPVRRQKGRDDGRRNLEKYW